MEPCSGGKQKGRVCLYRRQEHMQWAAACKVQPMHQCIIRTSFLIDKRAVTCSSRFTPRSNPFIAIPPLPLSASTGNADDAMVVFALLIINKAGGLVYNRTFAPGLQKLDSNDYLILAGTFPRLPPKPPTWTCAC